MIDSQAPPPSESNPFDDARRGDAPVWAFVANRLRVELPLPTELVPGHSLRQSTEEEATKVREFCRFLGPLVFWAPMPYYVVERVTKSPGPLNEGFHAIEEATRLTVPALDLSLTNQSLT